MFHCYLRGYFNGISELSHTANSLVEIALSDCPSPELFWTRKIRRRLAKRFWRDSSRFSRLWVFARSRFVKLLAQIAQKQLTRLRRRPFTLFKGALWPIEPSIDWECGDHVNRTTRNGDVVSRIALLLFKPRGHSRATPAPVATRATLVHCFRVVRIELTARIVHRPGPARRPFVVQSVGE